MVRRSDHVNFFSPRVTQGSQPSCLMAFSQLIGTSPPLALPNPFSIWLESAFPPTEWPAGLVSPDPQGTSTQASVPLRVLCRDGQGELVRQHS